MHGSRLHPYMVNPMLIPANKDTRIFEALFRGILRRKPPSGSGSDVVVLEPKYEHLRWLCSFIKSRSTSSNIPVNQLTFCDDDNPNNDVGIEDEDDEPRFYDLENNYCRHLCKVCFLLISTLVVRTIRNLSFMLYFDAIK